MSQKGRAERIRKVLEFIRDKDKLNISEVLSVFGVMGITQKTMEDYVKTLGKAGFIRANSEGSWEITEDGKKFLERDNSL